MSDTNDLRKLEYEALYKEILDNSQTIHRVLTFCGTATGAIIGYAMTRPFEHSTVNPTENLLLPFVLLVPFLIILPSMVLARSLLNSTTRISAYLYVGYEEMEQGIMWQHRIQAFRVREGKESNGGRSGKPGRFFARSMLIFFWLLGGGCAILSTLFLVYGVAKAWPDPRAYGLGASVVAVWLALIGLCVGILIKYSQALNDTWKAEAFQVYVSQWKAIMGLWEGSCDKT